jgi:septum formation inhibitor-activating ATPase MinD
MLIVLSGLPGVGKTTIARELARSLAAVDLRIESIEQALRQAGLLVEAEGYAVAQAVAADNLRVGQTVIADPRWTVQNRPLIDSSKPATTGVASETGQVYLIPSLVANPSAPSCASSVGRI